MNGSDLKGLRLLLRVTVVLFVLAKGVSAGAQSTPPDIDAGSCVVAAKAIAEELVRRLPDASRQKVAGHGLRLSIGVCSSHFTTDGVIAHGSRQVTADLAAAVGIPGDQLFLAGYEMSLDTPPQVMTLRDRPDSSSAFVYLPESSRAEGGHDTERAFIDLRRPDGNDVDAVILISHSAMSESERAPSGRRPIGVTSPDYTTALQDWTRVSAQNASQASMAVELTARPGAPRELSERKVHLDVVLFVRGGLATASSASIPPEWERRFSQLVTSAPKAAVEPQNSDPSAPIEKKEGLDWGAVAGGVLLLAIVAGVAVYFLRGAAAHPTSLKLTVQRTDQHSDSQTFSVALPSFSTKDDGKVIASFVGNRYASTDANTLECVALPPVRLFDLVVQGGRVVVHPTSFTMVRANRAAVQGDHVIDGHVSSHTVELIGKEVKGISKIESSVTVLVTITLEGGKKYQ